MTAPGSRSGEKNLVGKESEAGEGDEETHQQ
jgi:hypothetical protein